MHVNTNPLAVKAQSLLRVIQRDRGPSPDRQTDRREGLGGPGGPEREPPELLGRSQVHRCWWNPMYGVVGPAQGPGALHPQKAERQ